VRQHSGVAFSAIL